MLLKLTDTEKNLLLKLARDTLNAAFTEHDERPLVEIRMGNSLTAKLQEVIPCFVTLKQKNGRLRGCVGTTAGFESLYKNVFYFTRQAAFEDPRFDPVDEPELKDLKLDITVLGPQVKLEDFGKIEIGKHGLLVKGGSKRGLLLAQVATENGWNAEQFIKQTCVKAGLEPKKFQDYEWSYFEELEFSE